jgi:hypothetical protein
MTEQPEAQPQQPAAQPQPGVQPGQAVAAPGAGEQPAGGTQVSPAADRPAMTLYDDEGRPRTIPLDPQTGAPLEDPGV